MIIYRGNGMNLDEMKWKILSDSELVTGKEFQRRDFLLMEMEGMAMWNGWRRTANVAGE